MKPSALLLAFAVSALPVIAVADAPPSLDMRFAFKGRTFHYKVLVPDNGDIDIENVSVAAEDKQSQLTLKFRGSLTSGPDGLGHIPLTYKLELRGDNNVLLLSSEADVYVRPGTYSTVAQCGGWDFNLGYWTGKSSSLRVGTNNDRLSADVILTASPQQKQHCSQQIKPGGAAQVKAELVDPDGKPQPMSFQFITTDAPTNGAYPVTYKVDVPGLATQGQTNLVVGKGQKGGQSDTQQLWMTLVQDN